MADPEKPKKEIPAGERARRGLIKIFAALGDTRAQQTIDAGFPAPKKRKPKP